MIVESVRSDSGGCAGVRSDSGDCAGVRSDSSECAGVRSNVGEGKCTVLYTHHEVIPQLLLQLAHMHCPIHQNLSLEHPSLDQSSGLSFQPVSLLLLTSQPLLPQPYPLPPRPHHKSSTGWK